MFTKKLFILTMVLFITATLSTALYATEVNKGGIPGDHLKKSYKTLPWGSNIWDVPEAVTTLKAKAKVLWVDTRPASFFEKGSVRGAVLMPYDKAGKQGNDLDQQKLYEAISKSGLDKDSAKLVFFCQGPKCHRSYNAAYVAVTQWGFKAENVIWFRDGYPNLFKEVKSNPKLKRKAKRYISDRGIAQM